MVKLNNARIYKKKLLITIVSDKTVHSMGEKRKRLSFKLLKDCVRHGEFWDIARYLLQGIQSGL